MDPISKNVSAFLDLCGIEAEGHRKIILMKVQEALSQSATATKFSRIPDVTFLGGPIADKIYGISLAEIQNLFPDDEKLEFVTINGKLIVPSYFKGLLEKDFSSMFKDPEKAERMKELTLKNQFRSISKEAANLYLATRFGTEHLESIEDVSKEIVFETISKAYANGYLNDSILSIVKETIQKLDPSKISDIKYVVNLVCALKTRLEIKPEVSQFFKTSLTHSKKYNFFDRFKKWLNQYLPHFISRAINLLPKHDIKDLIDILSPMGEGIWGFEFPFALPNDKIALFALEPIKNRITYLDLSEFKELNEAEVNFIADFKNLRELKLDKEAKLPDNLNEQLKEISLIYPKFEEMPPIKADSPKKEENKPPEKSSSKETPSACASKDGEGASARDDAKEEAPQSNSAPPAADA